jgi:hypothetical protein
MKVYLLIKQMKVYQEAVSKNEASEFLPPKEEVVVQEEAATLMKGPIALAV